MRALLSLSVVFCPSSEVRSLGRGIQLQLVNGKTFNSQKRIGSHSAMPRCNNFKEKDLLCVHLRVWWQDLAFGFEIGSELFFIQE